MTAIEEYNYLKTELAKERKRQVKLLAQCKKLRKELLLLLSEDMSIAQSK